MLVLALGFLLFTTTRSALLTRAPYAAEALRSFDVEEPPPAMASTLSQLEPPANAAASPIAVSVPRIAYTYGYTFRLDRRRIASVQERHLALCRRLGPARCRIVSMRRGLGEGGDASGQLKLQVAAPLAEGFGRALAAISAGSGGDIVDRSIAAEDLSRQMIDSAARIRTREVLIRRLTGLLETRSGNIAQAVEAERAINTAQEELDAARIWLAEMQGRVAMSAIEIGYVARGATPPVRPGPIAAALAEVGGLSARSIATMIVLVGVTLPWLAFGLVFLQGARWVRRQRRAAESDPGNLPVE
jgi:hypothetical protein